MLFTSCNKDEVITEEVGGQPIIELDSETGIYTVKVDHELTIAPTYQNVEDALFAWTIDGTLVSSGPSLQRTWNECGDFYVKLRVDNAEGYAETATKAVGKIVAGCVQRFCDNATGADGAATVEVKRGTFVWENDGTIKNTDLLKPCYIKDDVTVSLTAEGSSYAGIILAVEDDGVTVDMMTQYRETVTGK